MTIVHPHPSNAKCNWQKTAIAQLKSNPAFEFTEYSSFSFKIFRFLYIGIFRRFTQVPRRLVSQTFPLSRGETYLQSKASSGRYRHLVCRIWAAAPESQAEGLC